jgi:hypothetical protein
MLYPQSYQSTLASHARLLKATRNFTGNWPPISHIDGISRVLAKAAVLGMKLMVKPPQKQLQTPTTHHKLHTPTKTIQASLPHPSPMAAYPSRHLLTQSHAALPPDPHNQRCRPVINHITASAKRIATFHKDWRMEGLMVLSRRPPLN